VARKRRNKTARRVITVAVLAILVGAGWWYWPRGDTSTAAETAPGKPLPTAGTSSDDALVPTAVVSDTTAPGAAAQPSTGAAADEPLKPIGGGAASATGVAQTPPPAHPSTGTSPHAGPDPAASTLSAETPPASSAEASQADADRPTAGETGEKLSNNPRINASLHRYKAGHVIEARQELNRMLAIERRPAVQAELRRHLRKIADATIFSKRCVPGDPLVEKYTIEPGDVLLAIGRQYEVPYEALMLVNGISNPARIRAGQRIKVLRGPFHVTIHKSAFRLDVYLRDLYVRSFPVGLGAEGGTPEGKWIVENRLKNPTYYPSASAEDKRIIPPDDPRNPLGERWIGLKGIEGDAVGREGYGIHGTIDPQSIGKAVSLGCVRMHNADVAFLYKLLMPGHSTVTVLP